MILQKFWEILNCLHFLQMWSPFSPSGDDDDDDGDVVNDYDDYYGDDDDNDDDYDDDDDDDNDDLFDDNVYQPFLAISSHSCHIQLFKGNFQPLTMTIKYLPCNL